MRYIFDLNEVVNGIVDELKKHIKVTKTCANDKLIITILLAVVTPYLNAL